MWLGSIIQLLIYSQAYFDNPTSSSMGCLLMAGVSAQLPSVRELGFIPCSFGTRLLC